MDLHRQKSNCNQCSGAEATDHASAWSGHPTIQAPQLQSLHLRVGWCTQKSYNIQSCNMFALSKKKQAQLGYIKLQKGLFNIGPIFSKSIFWESIKSEYTNLEYTNLSTPPVATFCNSAAWYEKWYGYTCEDLKLLAPASFNNGGVYVICENFISSNPSFLDWRGT